MSNIIMSARMNELIDIVADYEEEYRKNHSISPLVPLEDFIYEDAPQEIIDAYEEMMSEEICSDEYQ